jgi:nitrogen fixation protein FixH
MTSLSTRRFTGTHLAAIVVAFFAVVITVNMTMATLASRTFGGLIVANSYVASQDFDEGLAAGARQAALGWNVAARIDGGWVVVDARGADGAPLAGATGTATLRHPIGPMKTRALELHRRPDGTLAARHGLQPGQWDALVRLEAQGRPYRLEQRLVVGRN